MSAFGRRNGANGGGTGNGGGRPSFGTAQPMKGGGAPAQSKSAEGGAQFPPIEPEALEVEGAVTAPMPAGHAEAMARLADRQAQSG